MTYVITSACADVNDRTCVEVCPVDCIYEGARASYINPGECIDCGACEPVCPVEAIAYEVDLGTDREVWMADNARFFSEPLPGRDVALGRPGGNKKIGALGVDTTLIASLPMPEG